MSFSEKKSELNNDTLQNKFHVFIIVLDTNVYSETKKYYVHKCHLER